MVLNSMDLTKKSAVDIGANISENLCFLDWLPKN